MNTSAVIRQARADLRRSRRHDRRRLRRRRRVSRRATAAATAARWRRPLNVFTTCAWRACARALAHADCGHRIQSLARVSNAQLAATVRRGSKRWRRDLDNTSGSFVDRRRRGLRDFRRASRCFFVVVCNQL